MFQTFHIFFYYYKGLGECTRKLAGTVARLQLRTTTSDIFGKETKYTSYVYQRKIYNDTLCCVQHVHCAAYEPISN